MRLSFMIHVCVSQGVVAGAAATQTQFDAGAPRNERLAHSNSARSNQIVPLQADEGEPADPNDFCTQFRKAPCWKQCLQILCIPIVLPLWVLYNCILCRPCIWLLDRLARCCEVCMDKLR